MIKGLREGLPIVGFAKIGGPALKGGRNHPVKYDHFEITARDRDPNGQLIPDLDHLRHLVDHGAKTCGGCARSKELGFEDGLPIELPIMLPYDAIELIIPNKMSWYRGSKLYCYGDQETAHRRKVVETKKINGKNIPILGDFEEHQGCGFECPDWESGRCKPSARLHFTIQGTNSLAGLYRFDTTSWGSIANIVNALKRLKEMTGGVLRFVPVTLSIAEERVTPRDPSAPPSTAYIARIDYTGDYQTLLDQVRARRASEVGTLDEIRKIEHGLIPSSTEWNETPEDIEAFKAEFVDVDCPDTPAAGSPTEVDVSPSPRHDISGEGSSDEPNVSLGGDTPAEPQGAASGEGDDPIGDEQRQEILEAARSRAAEMKVEAALIIRESKSALNVASSSDLTMTTYLPFLEYVKKWEPTDA